MVEKRNVRRTTVDEIVSEMYSPLFWFGNIVEDIAGKINQHRYRGNTIWTAS